jgi:hypothetical protein
MHEWLPPPESPVTRKSDGVGAAFVRRPCRAKAPHDAFAEGGIEGVRLLNAAHLAEARRASPEMPVSSTWMGTRRRASAADVQGVASPHAADSDFHGRSTPNLDVRRMSREP